MAALNGGSDMVASNSDNCVCNRSRGGGHLLALRFGTRRITPGLSLALIGNASGKTVEEGQKSRSEAFSIRRLGGSRWRLRRTRCAMGFERQLAAKSRVGQAPTNGKGRVAIVDSVARAGKSVRRKPARKPVAVG